MRCYEKMKKEFQVTDANMPNSTKWFTLMGTMIWIKTDRETGYRLTTSSTAGLKTQGNIWFGHASFDNTRAYPLSVQYPKMQLCSIIAVAAFHFILHW